MGHAKGCGSYIFFLLFRGSGIMADPAAPIDICNLALTELKLDPISSLDQAGSKVAALCNRHYDVRRKALLRAHIWNFAKSEAQLALSTTGSSNSYDDVYPLGKTYLRLISIGDVFVWTKNDFYDIRSIDIDGTFQKSIVIDNSTSATLDIMFIRNVISVVEFDPLFVVLFKFELANDIAPGITLKPSVKESILRGLTNARLQARSIDGQERPPKRIQNSRFLRVRRSASFSQINSIRTVFE